MFYAELCLAKQSRNAPKSQTTLFSWKNAPSKSRRIQGGKAVAAQPILQQDGSRLTESTDAPPAPVWTFSSARRKGAGKKGDTLQVKTYIVARRFYGCVSLDVDAQLSFAKHVDDRGSRCFAAFFRSGVLWPQPPRRSDGISIENRILK